MSYEVSIRHMDRTMPIGWGAEVKIPRPSCIILNGPPGSGKDTLCHIMKSAFHFSHKEFKSALYEETLRHFDLSEEHTNLFVRRDLKDAECTLFGGLTPRQALIYVSEKLIKPNYGDNFFGVKAARAVAHCRSPIVIFSDGGFKAEVEELKKVSKVLVVQLHKEGLDFSGDSRSYLTNGHKTVILRINEGMQHVNAEQLKSEIHKFVRG